MPPHLIKCLMKDPKGAATADQYVANTELTLQEKKACAKNLLAWYKEHQKASKTAANAAKRPTVTK